MRHKRIFYCLFRMKHVQIRCKCKRFALFLLRAPFFSLFLPIHSLVLCAFICVEPCLPLCPLLSIADPSSLMDFRKTFCFRRFDFTVFQCNNYIRVYLWQRVRIAERNIQKHYNKQSTTLWYIKMIKDTMYLVHGYFFIRTELALVLFIRYESQFGVLVVGEKSGVINYAIRKSSACFYDKR